MLPGRFFSRTVARRFTTVATMILYINLVLALPLRGTVRAYYPDDGDDYSSYGGYDSGSYDYSSYDANVSISSQPDSDTAYSSGSEADSFSGTASYPDTSGGYSDYGTYSSPNYDDYSPSYSNDDSSSASAPASSSASSSDSSSRGWWSSACQPSGPGLTLPRTQ